MDLTKPQFAFLELCEMYTGKQETVGAIAKGSTLRCAATLERLGLVELIAHGVEVDGDNGGDWRDDWPIYAITSAGRAYLSGKT